MDTEYVPFLMITANVGSVFEDVSTDYCYFVLSPPLSLSISISISVDLPLSFSRNSLESNEIQNNNK